MMFTSTAMNELRESQLNQQNDENSIYKRSIKHKLASMMVKGQVLAIIATIVIALLLFLGHYATTRVKVQQQII